MTYLETVNVFEREESGTDAFKNLHRSLLNLMKSDPAHAAAYYIIGTAAHNYVMRYEDQAVEPETADKAKQALLGFCKKFAAVLNASGEEKLAAISAIANDYEWKIANF
ncbi:hypothetical protein [Kerstersia sp.]|uniref:hypothetical protein n=1 Tax=Kerstersia sp. TaxID=1930783 RepID=UPI003F8F6FF8